jgi:hypothetical protein
MEQMQDIHIWECKAGTIFRLSRPKANLVEDGALTDPPVSF